MFRIIFGAASLLLMSNVVWAQAQAGYAGQEVNLRGLYGVRLEVVLGGYPHRLDEAQRPEVLKVVEADAAAKLEKAGIPLFRLNSETSIKAGSPKLVITVTMDKGEVSMPLRTEVKLLQKVRLARDPSIETDAVTWSTHGVGGPKLRDSMIREQVGSEIDEFIRDYLAVNPKQAARVKEKTN